MVNKSRYYFWKLIRTTLPLYLVLASCASHPNADAIISKAIKKAGGSKFTHSRITFRFRDKKYIAERNGGHFLYQRIFMDSTGAQIVDQLMNKGFTRKRNGSQVSLSADKKSAYANSVNSVIYFASLPYKLNDPAVQKKYLGTSTIKDEPYYKIGVSFEQKGGGEDYDDYFVYWIHQKKYTIDYLAYDFEENGGGTRFRVAKNIRMVKGIRFADYTNFKGVAKGDSLERYENLFKDGKVEKVSEINLQNIKVTILDREQKVP